MKNQYLSAAAGIRNWVARRQLVPGMVLPSARVLAAEFGLTEGVAERACQVLITQGFLRREGYKLHLKASDEGPPAVHGVVIIVSYLEPFIRVARRELTDRGWNTGQSPFRSRSTPTWYRF